MEVTLWEMLEARERRVLRQQALLSEYGRTLLCFTMNIAGPVKNSPPIRRGFALGMKLLDNQFQVAGIGVLHREQSSAHTGSEAFFVLDSDPLAVKAVTTQIEDQTTAGRLFDMDVLCVDGRKVDRRELGLPGRKCLICGNQAQACARSRTHPVAELQEKTSQILLAAIREDNVQTIASLACRSLLYEVATTPKPGLVDRKNSGSHKDMDFFTFVDSSAALAPWFRRFFLAGWDHAGGLFGVLRALGQQAETDMFAATKGVNTHKGLIFSMAILCGALGRASAEAFPQSPSLDQISEIARSLGADSMKDFAASSGETSGLRCYHAHGLSGIRGEAAAGFPAVINVGLPTLRQWLSRGVSLNDASCAALLALIAAVDDTNMIHRGGYEEAAARKTEARCLSAALRAERICPALSALNEAYIQKNLSPGGCADLLALTLFFHFLNL